MAPCGRTELQDRRRMVVVNVRIHAIEDKHALRATAYVHGIMQELRVQLGAVESGR